MPAQTNMPEDSAGGLDEDGRRDRYGASMYATGNRERKSLYARSVPSRAEMYGYRKSCVNIPMIPRMLNASPIVAGGMARPPVK